jgi:chromosome partitioning protein
MAQTKILAVFNHKGGVGKTCTAVNLAACLVRLHGKRCLVVDMDPQANATRALLGKDLDSRQPTLCDVLLEESERGPVLPDLLLPTVIRGLMVLPAELGLSQAEFKLVSRMRREYVLRDKLLTMEPSYDYVIIDCAPGLGLLSLNALTAADAVVVPCETQFLSLRGLKYVLDIVGLVRDRLNPGVRLLGVLGTKYYILSRANNEALQCLRKLTHVHVFKSVIPRDVRAEEAPSHGQPLIDYAPDSRSARAYAAFAEEVMTLCHD